MVGLVRHGNLWQLSHNDRKYPGLLAAAEQIAALTNRVHAIAAKLSHGVQVLPAVSGYSQVITYVWRPSSSYVRTVTGDLDTIGRVRLYKEFPDWEQLYSLQLFSSAETDLEADSVGGYEVRETGNGEPDVIEATDQLSTIPEEGESFDESLCDYLSHSEEQFQRILEQTTAHYSEFLEGAVPESNSDEEFLDDSVYRTPLSLFTSDCDEVLDQNTLASFRSDGLLGQDAAPLDDSVELAYYWPMTNLLDFDDRVQEGELVLASMSRSNDVKRQVVVKEDDLLTPNEVKQQYPEVQKAMLKELKTWADLKCFSRKPRKEAKNVIDIRWFTSINGRSLSRTGNLPRARLVIVKLKAIGRFGPG